MKEKKHNLELLRQNSMVRILEEAGHSVKHKGVLYHSPFRPDNNPSLHIDDNRHVWHDFGDTTPSHVKPGQACASGDIFDFVRLLLGYPLNVDKESDSYRKSFAAAVDYLASRTPGATVTVEDSRFDTDKLVSSLRHGPLKGFTILSGGAVGADTAWGEEAGKEGAKIVHYYHPSRKTPNGNTPISKEDIDEGAVRAAEAAARMYGFKYNRMKDYNIIRDWSQVKDSEVVFAVGRLAPKGERFRQDVADDDRVLSCDTVTGGTGYAVNMAILKGLPVYVFNQEENGAFEKGWYEYDYEKQAYERLGHVPALQKRSTCIGSRNLTDEGRKAIADVVKMTLMREREVDKASGSPSARPDAYMDTLDESRKVNIWAGTNENVILSNLAGTPYVVGECLFRSVEHEFQWRKAVLFGDEATADLILNAKDPSDARSLGRRVKGYDDARWNDVRDGVMEEALRHKFRSCPEAFAALLSTGNAVLTHVQDPGHWKEVFPALLMRLRYEYSLELEGEMGEYRGESHWVIETVRQGVSFAPLKEYMEKERHIGAKQLARYCGEVKVHQEYTKDGKKESGPSIIAVGFPNKSGGFELRKESYVNKDGERVDGMKKCTSKDYTLIDSRGRFLNKLTVTSDTVYVFEGFTDFLSYLCWNGIVIPDGDCVILNSTSMARPAVPYLAQHGKVVCYLDNDNAGRETTSLIARETYAAAKAAGHEVSVQDGAEAYAGYKDINEAYSAVCAEQAVRAIERSSDDEMSY